MLDAILASGWLLVPLDFGSPNHEYVHALGCCSNYQCSELNGLDFWFLWFFSVFMLKCLKIKISSWNRCLLSCLATKPLELAGLLNSCILPGRSCWIIPHAWTIYISSQSLRINHWLGPCLSPLRPPLLGLLKTCLGPKDSDEV
jgi:hypothetical protein